ncbi:MAG TPA: pirin family protein [Arenimonas sp.]|uniref:pirin family protein n=1 Tax=Arenimonas sp. TaxID=1872635 RepID=UPI002CDDC641|nr:pirin family protein [Arenimonas sp.]HMB57089.1 pirin family protein [Arenimonas sp.]
MPLLIAPRMHDLGGFTVGRVLPSAQRRSVGPFVFFDHIGPAVLSGDQPVAVRPHPHIGLATVTYLWEGAMMHRDSLGSVQEINPGDVNWMTAGRGIVHSERTPERLRGIDHAFHGLQTWVALPMAHEDTEPTFAHHPKATLPMIEGDGVQLTIVAGHAFGERSPVKVLSDTLYVSIDLADGAELVIPAEHAERALYPVAGELWLDDERLPNQQLAVLDADTLPLLRSVGASRVMLLGGEPLDGPRHVWWNFVSSSKERIEQAKAHWREGRLGQVPGETEFIPLPEK